jgi:hypothetical protein
MTTVPLGHSISNPIFAGLAIEEDLLLDEDLKFSSRAELGVIYFRNVNLGKELKMTKICIY